jgi:DNA modification methylase
MADIEVRTGDAFDVLPELPADHVHAVVTDPPYGLAFMGRGWDDFEPKEYQAWCEDWASEVRRVLKPGGHLLAFSGNRTHHRLFSGVEDVGFEIRDTVTWHYGSGFPKALDVAKSIESKLETGSCAENNFQDLEGEKTDRHATDLGFDNKKASIGARPSDYNETNEEYLETVDYQNPEAERWAGFKTALKPATEYVVVARAPLSEGTVAENVQTHGTGAVNIDGCRVETDGDRPDRGGQNNGSDSVFGQVQGSNYATGTTTEGRYPSNVVFDQSADTDDVPTRYYYTSKASRSERTEDGRLPNDHPTVKPVDLMEWLVRLVTAEGQTVLDPFAGSGTTLKAAKELGRGAIGIERQPEYADLARARAGLTPEQPGRFVEADATTLDAYTDGGGGD